MFYSLIPAGGSGTRLWPLSRADHPKFLQALTDSGLSLLQATAGRLASLAPPERTYVVTGTTHVAGVARQLPDVPVENILVEPSPRDSCAAIALGAAVIARRDPDAIMGSFAADHLIQNVDGFLTAVKNAVSGAQAGYIMTVGVTPVRPETAYGYLEQGDAVPGLPIYLVNEFKEKPDAATAEEYLKSGQHYWNASIFVFQARVFLEELGRLQPKLHANILKIADSWGTPAQQEVLAEIWPEIPKVAVDYAVMEEAAAQGRVATVHGGFDWTDVGDFDSLGRLVSPDDSGAVILSKTEGSTVLCRDSERVVIVPAGDRLVATLGVSDLVVVDTPDVVFVFAREHGQDVKKVVEELRDRDGERYL